MGHRVEHQGEGQPGEGLPVDMWTNTALCLLEYRLWSLCLVKTTREANSACKGDRMRLTGRVLNNIQNATLDLCCRLTSLLLFSSGLQDTRDHVTVDQIHLLFWNFSNHFNIPSEKKQAMKKPKSMFAAT